MAGRRGMAAVRGPGDAIPALAIALALGLGGWAAFEQRWLADDAFISFRYARNLTDGLGLVFNPGEYVEGFSNLLWTLGCALGLELGIEPETWTQAFGIACYLASILLLGLHHLGLRGALEIRGATLPVAALGAAAMHELHVYATSGLETSAFALLCLLGAQLLLFRREADLARLALAGLCFGCASLTRPEGILLAFLGGLFVLWDSPRRWRSAIARGSLFAGAVLVLWVPLSIWRLSYYGDFFPNPYYAKSAYLAWYSQGWHYLRLFFQRYWALLLGPGVLLALAVRGRGGDPGLRFARRHALLSLAFAGGWTWYVWRIGGDFMYGRMLLPAVPYALILLELCVALLPGQAARLLAAVAIASALGLSSWTSPAIRFSHGIVDEQRYYPTGQSAALERRARILERYFEGLPVRVAFSGSDARLVYRARIPVAIESAAGLTDRFIARQPLEKRGRVGHEKRASLSYLVRERRVHFALGAQTFRIVGAQGRIPVYEIHFDGKRCFALHWDAGLMEALRDRGAVFEDFLADLDQLIPALPSMQKAEVRATYESLKLFYFDHAFDEEREAAFLRALGS
jgi:hypothetical protein